ncbi:MAG: protein kinase [Candidatus Eremiobacteraeota bacterium]|nr:protein kinase [Candidatus Eremiobacteraeota bacterium]
MIDLVGKTLQGRYKIERFLGQGGMSTVFLGEHLRLGRKLAIKALAPGVTNVRQLESEARIMASLSHPGLALVLDFFEESGRTYMVMEFVNGRDLDEVAKLAPNPLSQRRVLEFADQLLDVLEYLHSQEPPVIVRDLKPGNVMMDEGGRLRLIDFGLAKRLQPVPGGKELGMGSMGYAPIEQYGRGVADQRSDLYALGAVMLFLLGDQVPPDAGSRLKEGKALPDPRPANASVSDSLWAALQKMLELEPDKRPSRVAEVRQLLGLVPGPVEPQPVEKPTTRLCPICQLALQATPKQKVEIDVCPQCGGVWLDRGELEQLAEVAQVYPEPAKKRTFWEQLSALIKG